MTLTTLIIIAAGGLVLVVILAGLIGFILLRRRRGSAEVEAVKTKPAPKSQTKPKIRKLAQQPTPTNETAPPAKSVAAPPPPVPTPITPVVTDHIAAPLPISDGEQPDESGEKIKILVVDDNPGTRENVSRLLYFEDDMEVIGQAINGRQGIDMAGELRPHIVLMDINMPDMDGITATGEMSLKTPYSQVIIMSVQAERHYMKQAMAAGARDFQPKPFTSDELISCIRRVYEIGRPIYRQIEAIERAGPQIAAQTPQQAAAQADGGAPVIVVYSSKGGIGTSTIAVNLATALQQLQGDVALMDGDLQFGDVSVHLNIQPSRTMVDAIHKGELDTELLPELMLAHNSGLKLLLAPHQPELADSVTPEMLPKIIKTLKRQFNAVIVDTQTQLTDKTLSILDNADHILVITSPELPAIKNAKLFLDLAAQLEIASERIDVVMNYAKLPGGIPTDKIEKALKVSSSFHIPYDPRLRTATNRGVTVIQQDSGAPAARAIMALAEAIWNKASADQPAPTVKEVA